MREERRKYLKTVGALIGSLVIPLGLEVFPITLFTTRRRRSPTPSLTPTPTPTSTPTATPDPTPKLKFRTDFTDLKIVGHQLQYKDGSPFPMRQNLNYEDGTATCAIVDDPTATGGKSFFMKVFKGLPKSTRFEVNWCLGDLGLTNEFFIDVRLKLLPDYHLEPSGSSWCGHHEITNPTTEWASDNPAPYMTHLMYEECPAGEKGFELLINHEGTGKVYYDGYVPMAIPKGVWFHLKTYVKRHRTEGIIKIWINNTLLFNVSNVCTKDREDFYSEVAKLYDGEILPEKQLWVDTIEIYEGSF